MEPNHSEESPIPLLPGERVLSVAESRPSHSAETSRRRLSAMAAMYDLAGGDGSPGPVVAALPSPEYVGNPEHELYEVVFGRDSLRVALDLVNIRPALTRNTLVELARLQGTTTNVRREEEPGRIVHEVRTSDDPIAQQLTRERGWEWPYYGSVDSTPEFIRTLAAYCQQSPEGYDLLSQTFVNKDGDGQEQNMMGALQAALDWITGRLDANPEGLLEHKPAFSGSIENQVWRDSWDSFFHANGEMANAERGIAAFDVQRVTMDALLDATEIFQHTGQHTDQIPELRARADKLRHIILDRFWVDTDGGYFALGTDRDHSGKLRPLAIQTSDMGHALHSRLLSGVQPEIVARREALIKTLFSKQMLSINGIRTLSDQEVRFRSGAYHNGSVWIWDNYLITQGLKSHGHEYQYLANLVNNILLNVVMATERFTEFLRGDSDADEPYQLNTRRVVVWDEHAGRENVIEQPPQDIQAFTAAAIYAIRTSNGPGKGAKHPSQLPSSFEQEILESIAQRSDYWQRQVEIVLPTS